MNQYGYALAVLATLVAAVLVALVFALVRFSTRARAGNARRRAHGAESALLAAALEGAVAKLKAQEQATSARAAATEQLSAQIVDSLTAGLMVVDRHGRIEILNRAGRRLLGGVDDAKGVTYHEALSSVRPLADAIEECLNTGIPIVRRTLRMPAGSTPSHFGVTVSPLRGADELQGVICLFSDLTAVVEMEEQLRLKDALARLGELTAGLAHEFRNGLATIHGYSRLIEVDALPPQYQPYVEGIRNETEAMGRVVTNFLAFARPDSVVLAPVTLEALIRRSAEELRHELPAGTEIEITGGFGEIQGDEVLLKQVFGNLVRNAAEACAGAGRTPRIAIVGVIDAESRVCRVHVDDNGPGVPEAARDRIFRPFFTTRPGGTGLGLAIVQKIVLTHNGKITVGTSVHGGASMQLTFHLAES